MAAELSVDLVGRLYRDGVESVERITADMGGRAWEQPACGRWTGTQTARHLVAVARWYHEWLDRAIAGDASLPFPASEMDRRNDGALAAIGDISGSEAIAEFAETATAYLGRAVDHWNLAYGYPYGTATVGLHCGCGRRRMASPCMGPVSHLEEPPSPSEPRGIVHRCGDVPCRGQRWIAGKYVAVPRTSRVSPQPLARPIEEIRPHASRTNKPGRLSPTVSATAQSALAGTYPGGGPHG